MWTNTFTQKIFPPAAECQIVRHIFPEKHEVKCYPPNAEHFRWSTVIGTYVVSEFPGQATYSYRTWWVLYLRDDFHVRVWWQNCFELSKNVSGASFVCERQFLLTSIIWETISPLRRKKCVRQWGKLHLLHDRITLLTTVIFFNILFRLGFYLRQTWNFVLNS